MEQTEIEKKAEEYAVVSCGSHPNQEDLREVAKQAYIEGYKDGQPKWHDLRKNPNDLPDNGRRVLVKDKSRKEYDIACLCRSKPDSDFWSYERFTTRVNDNYVVAWCDFPRFEE